MPYFYKIRLDISIPRIPKGMRGYPLFMWINILKLLQNRLYIIDFLLYQGL